MIEFHMSIRALQLGYKVGEIVTIEGDRMGGENTAKSFPTGFKAFGLLWYEMRV